MKLRLPRRRIWRAAIYLGSLLLVVIAIDLVLIEVRRTIHPGYDTTRIAAPALPDGSIDYVAAQENVFSRGVTPENNAAIPILQALGRIAFEPSQPPDGITSRLGMPPLPKAGDYYITNADYSRDPGKGEPDPTWIDRQLIWPVTIKPAIAEWVNTNERPLALLAEAAKRPRFFIPYRGGKEPMTLMGLKAPHVRLLIDACRALCSRALMRLETGDTRGFIADIHTSHRLARLLGQDATAFGRSGGLIIEQSTGHIERLGITSGKFTPQQVREMRVDLASMDEQPDMIDCLDFGMRFSILDEVQLTERGRLDRTRLFGEMFDIKEFGFLKPLWPVSCDRTMRAFNRYLDSAIIVARQPTYALRSEAAHQFNRQLEADAWGNRVLRFLTGESRPPLPAVWLRSLYEQVDIIRTETVLTQLALALAEFKAEHGTYPALLAELAPTYFATVPEDLFSDRPFIYARTAAGYTLYSVGPNMVDDGGKSEKPADDVLANMP